MSTEAPAMQWFCNYGKQHRLGQACDCSPATGAKDVLERVCSRCGKVESITLFTPNANAAAGGIGAFIPVAEGLQLPPNPAAIAAAAPALGPCWTYPDDFCQCPPDESQDWKGLYLTGLEERKRLEHELRQVHANLSSALVREKALQEQLDDRRHEGIEKDLAS